jgi:hypothetical protein
LADRLKRSHSERTRREDRRLNFYIERDNLTLDAADASATCMPALRIRWCRLNPRSVDRRPCRLVATPQSDGKVAQMRTSASCCRGLGRLLLLVAVALLPAGSAQADPRFSQPRLTGEVLAPPSPVLRTDNRRHLVYEIVMRNRTTARAVIERLVVVDQRRSMLGSFGSETIRTLLGPNGLPLAPDPEIGPGATLTLYLDVILPRGRRAPSSLAHRFVFSLQRDSGHARRVRVVGARTTVERRTPISVSPPLRGSKILGVMAHAPQTINDGLSHAQRYAIDFVGLNQAGDGFADGDPLRNESYAIYGDEIFAVAPGTIVAVRNDLAENTPPTEPPFTTYDDVAGNRVVQHLGGDRYALYAHMQPGSVRVNVGQRVERGQVLGLVGNTGISSGPHLHFQVMNSPGGPSALESNGLPYVFDRFTLVSEVANINAVLLLGDRPVLTPASPPPERANQYLRSGDVIDVP